MKKSLKLIFLDINNIILDEKIKLEDGDELRKDIQEKFEFIHSIIDNFKNNQILIDLETEEKYSVQQNSFIYQIEEGVMQNYKFILYRQLINNIFNFEIEAFFIVIDLEKEFVNELLEKIINKISENTKIKMYILGIYKSKNDVKVTKEKIDDLFVDQKQTIDYKYIEVNINDDKEDINQKMDNFIEEAMLDVYKAEKENDNFEVPKKKKFSHKETDNVADSVCMII